MHIIIATCREYPNLSDSERYYAAALEQLGAKVSILPWNESDFEQFLMANGVILRATWDYQTYPTEFATWVQALEKQGATVFNCATLAIWNNDKRHIIELEAAGFFVPKTSQLSSSDLESGLKAISGDKLVLKPVFGGSGKGVRLINRTQAIAEIESCMATLQNREWMLQEFLPEISEGEISLIYIDHQFSHAVIKRPATGEFRVNRKFGAQWESICPSQTFIETGQSILDWLPYRTLYARIDGVVRHEHFMCTELELTDPSLMFDFAPDAAKRLANATLKRIKIRREGA